MFRHKLWNLRKGFYEDKGPIKGTFDQEVLLF